MKHNESNCVTSHAYILLKTLIKFVKRKWKTITGEEKCTLISLISQVHIIGWLCSTNQKESLLRIFYISRSLCWFSFLKMPFLQTLLNLVTDVASSWQNLLLQICRLQIHPVSLPYIPEVDRAASGLVDMFLEQAWEDVCLVKMPPQTAGSSQWGDAHGRHQCSSRLWHLNDVQLVLRAVQCARKNHSQRHFPTSFSPNNAQMGACQLIHLSDMWIF